MPATFTSRILEDGPRNVILLVNGDNGGAGGGDLASTNLILPSQTGVVNPGTQSKCAQFRVDKIEWDIQAEATFTVNLAWDATVPVLFYHMIGRGNKFFKDFGGLYQQTGIAGSTGGIDISTTGASTTALQTYTFVLYLVKDGQNPA